MLLVDQHLLLGPRPKDLLLEGGVACHGQQAGYIKPTLGTETTLMEG